MPIRARAKLLGGCCLLAMLVGAMGAMGCHHDRNDYDHSRQSGYYQDRGDNGHHADYGHDRARGDSDRGDYDHR